jgi:hypothetical protein
LHPDRPPSDPAVRPIARRLHAAGRHLPIVYVSRRLDAGFLARLVAEHRLDEDEAVDGLVGLVADQPREVFKL